MRNYESKKIISSMNLRRNMPRKPTTPSVVQNKIEIKNEEETKKTNNKTSEHKLYLNGISPAIEKNTKEEFNTLKKEKYSITKNGYHLIIENDSKKVRVKLSENQMQMLTVAFNL